MARVDMAKLMESVDTFRTEVDIALEAIKHKLESGEYATAAEGFNVLSQRVAKTNVSLRAVLIQGGYIATSE